MLQRFPRCKEAMVSDLHFYLQQARTLQYEVALEYRSHGQAPSVALKNKFIVC